ncbi:lysoplasmalogenase TMEM86A-like [Styela clava]
MACSSSDEDYATCADSKHTKFTYFGPRLVPFLKTACVYMVLVPEINPPNIVVAILKCLPMLSLCIFVLWFDGFGFTSRHQYSRRILAGLLLSTLGDFCLVYTDEGYFIHGVACFGIAHLMYIFAFGFRPLRPQIYLLLSCVGFAIYWYIYAGLTDTVLKFSVLGYILVIVGMNWRAVAKIRNLSDLKAGVTSSSHKKWTHLVACIGSVLFLISDCCLAINRFHSPVTHQRWIVMTTYYLAQLAIALSVVKNRNVDLIRRRKLSKKKGDLKPEHLENHTDNQSTVNCDTSDNVVACHVKSE